MNDQFDNLKNLWQNAKKMDYGQSMDTRQIIDIARQKFRSTISLQIGTIIILIITLLGISAFFFYVAGFVQLISYLGEGLMIGGLVLRIIIELFSIYFSTHINLSESALKTNNAALKYFQFRKRINGPVTIAILVLYTIGFYLLTPEFSLYFRTNILILIDLSYILGAVIFTWFIRKTIKKEMKILNEILRIQHDLIDDGVNEMGKA